MRWLFVVMLLTVLGTQMGCGGGSTTPIQKTEPLPAQRFPRPDK